MTPAEEKWPMSSITRLRQIGRPGIIRLVLHLVAIALISFVVGFGIVALSETSPGGNQFAIVNESLFHSPVVSTVPLDGAKSATIVIEFGTGNLRIDSGGEELLTATIYGQDPNIRPVVEAGSTGNEKIVRISQKTGRPAFPNRWDLVVSERVPVSLDVTAGTGDVDLDLAGLNLTALRVVSGAGDTMVDLSGYRGADFTGTITQNVGDLTIRVSDDRNVIIHAKSSVGDVEATGFMEHDGSFSTTGQPGIGITVAQGVGSVILEAV